MQHVKVVTCMYVEQLNCQHKQITFKLELKSKMLNLTFILSLFFTLTSIVNQLMIQELILRFFIY